MEVREQLFGVSSFLHCVVLGLELRLSGSVTSTSDNHLTGPHFTTLLTLGQTEQPAQDHRETIHIIKASTHVASTGLQG